MPSTMLDMSMSLDGFVAGPNESPENGLGDGGERLHEWLFHEPARESGIPSQPPGINGQVYAQVLTTGAVVAGRGTAEPAGYWGGDHHDGVPIFILSRRATDSEQQRWPLVHYVDDVSVAMALAREAAGERDVLVHGVGTARLALAAGVLDEIQLHVIPVLLGEGRRLFEGGGPEHIELERTQVLVGEEGVTHLRYRVRR